MDKKFLMAIALCFGVVTVSFAAVNPAAIKAAKESAVAALKSKEWAIYLTPEEGQKGVSSDTDILTFTDGTILSKNLSTKGYLASNFGLTIQNDGTAVWETMQVDETQKDLAFLRGELLTNGIMQGTLFLKPQKGQKVTYYFSTTAPVVNTAPPPKKK